MLQTGYVSFGGSLVPIPNANVKADAAAEVKAEVKKDDAGAAVKAADALIADLGVAAAPPAPAAGAAAAEVKANDQPVPAAAAADAKPAADAAKADLPQAVPAAVIPAKIDLVHADEKKEVKVRYQS